ncbi:MAG TPA: site-specific integrase [Bacteroidales bacterium]|nr:site-specific integrase [Bacteroidales bacterium]
MAKAKKLPSGSWRCLVYDYTDENKKRHYKSFTSSDPSPAGKREVERQAANYAADRENISTHGNITVKTAIRKYIDMKKEVLSASTVRGYENMLNIRFKDIENKDIDKLKNTEVQLWISKLAKDISPKSLRNAYSLLCSSIKIFLPNKTFSATLPQKKKPDLHVPSDSEVKSLICYVKDTELELAILLAAFGPMRRGEICALRDEDIQGNKIIVRRCMVRKYGGGWIEKQPKTYSSYRELEMPDFIIDKIKNIEGRIIKATPDQITNRFTRAITYSKSQKFRFHDLRHYSASIMHAIGVPDQYIMERGGWNSDYVMKTVYRNSIDEQTRKYTDVINGHFETMQHDMQHDD